jgi:hypothetical protein
MRAAVIILVVLTGYAFAALQEESDSTAKADGADSLRSALQDKVAVIFKRSCATSGCHRGKNAKVGLDLEPDKMTEAMVGKPSRQKGSLKLIDTSDPDKSYLMMKIRGDKGISGKKMPIWVKALTKEEIETVSEWVGTFKAPDEDSEKDTDEEDTHDS